MTKKQRGMYEAYQAAFNRGPKTELYQVYGNYSHAKQEALDDCKSLQSKYDGYNGTIVSHNSFVFTYAFEFVDYELGGTNKVRWLYYITPSNDYKFSIEEV